MYRHLIGAVHFKLVGLGPAQWLSLSLVSLVGVTGTVPLTMITN
nr:hypothetical protein [Desulforamulus aquiferis]